MELSRLNRPERANLTHFPVQLPPPKQEQAALLRLCTYNVRIDHPLDQEGAHSWDARKDAIIRIIQHYQPTVIAFQEADKKQVEYLRRNLSKYHFIDHAARPETDESEHLPIAFLSNELQCVQQGRFWLSDTPETPSIGWDACYARICSWAQLYSPQQKSTIWVMNTHLDHKGIQAREEGVKLIKERISHLVGQDTAVLMGDLNLFPDFGGPEVYQSILQGQNGLHDVRDQTDQHYGPDGTWIGWQYDPYPCPPNKVGSRLDHIFTTGPCAVLQEGVLNFSVDTHQAVHDPYPNALLPERLYPSDHLPVLADLVIPA